MDTTHDFHPNNHYSGSSLKSSDKFRRRYISNLGTPYSSSDAKKENNKVHTNPKFIGRNEQCNSPMWQKLNKSNRRLSQRKRKLFDNYEHRVHLTTAWDWASFCFTCTVASLTLVSEYAYLHSEDFMQVNIHIQRMYVFFTLFPGTIPYVWLILKGIYYGKNSKKTKKSRGEHCIYDFLYAIAAIPAWIVVGAILFSTKLICVTAICKLWWSMLSVYSVEYPSSSCGVNQVKMHSEKLTIDDVVLIDKKENNDYRVSTDDHGFKASIVEKIKRQADIRRKRLVNDMLDLPRDDLHVDIELLNKLVFLELCLKFLPQFFLSLLINKSVFEVKTFRDTSQIIYFAASCISITASIRSNWKILKNRSWASTFNGATDSHQLQTNAVTGQYRQAEKMIHEPVAGSKKLIGESMISTRLQMSPNTYKNRDALRASLVKRFTTKNYDRANFRMLKKPTVLSDISNTT